MTEQRVRIEVADHVAMVTLTRPDKHNALDWRCSRRSSMPPSGRRASRGVRAVVLHGDGPSFCSGLDVASMMAGEAGLDGLPIA